MTSFICPKLGLSFEVFDVWEPPDPDLGVLASKAWSSRLGVPKSFMNPQTSTFRVGV